MPLWAPRCLPTCAVHAALIAAAVLLQGCAEHEIGNWRVRTNYELNFQFVPPGMRADRAELNSCMATDVPKAARCNGHGTCRQWRTSPTASTEDYADSGLFFCVCDREWADPECRTRRKSQRMSYVLAIFFGMLGADQIYLGFYRRALAKTLTLGGCGFWYLFDIVRTGAAPAYAWDSYRVANDLPYWQFLISLMSLLFLVAFALGVTSIMYHRLQKSRDILVLQVEERYLESERQRAVADAGYAGAQPTPTTASPQAASRSRSFHGYGSVI